MKFQKTPSYTVQFKSCLIFVFAVLLTSCGGGGGSSTTPPPLIQAFLISLPSSSVPPANFPNALVSITDSSTGAAITDATVTMNGVTLTYNSAPTHQEYEGTLLVNPGDQVTLVAKVGDNTYTASGTQFTSYPTISSPTSGTTWSASSDNTVTWSGGAPVANSSYLLGVLDAADPDDLTAYFHGLPTSTTSFSIPAYSSITGGSRDLLVGLVTNASVSNAAANSSFLLGGFDYVPITVTGLPLTFQASGTPNIVGGVAWSGSKFVAVGYSGTIITSPDGISWTSRNSGTSKGLSKVVWSGTQFVVVGDPGVILTSPDGITWTSRTSGTVEPLYGIASSGAELVAVGFTGTILTSPDGITWTSRTSGISDVLNDVVWSGSQFVAVGRGGAILTSPDGVVWTAQSSGVDNMSFLNGIIWSGTQFVVVGDASAPCYCDFILTSPDGVTWTSRYSKSIAYLNSVAWSGTEFLAVGWAGNTGTILTSPDGITWTQQASGTTTYLYDVIWSGTKYVITEYGNKILTSP